MHVEGLPKSLISLETLDELMTLLLEKEELRHTIKYTDFGSRITGDEDEKWMREGWSHLVQWQVARHLFRQEDNSVYLYHVLVQTIGELRFACRLICMAFRMKVPRKVRRIRTIYQSNSLFSFFTGTPGFDVESLVDHGIGTAFYFVAERRIGLQKTIWKLPLTKDLDH